MKHLKLENGDTMPALGLGTWKSEPGEVAAAVKEAIRIGYRHIDCAAIYGNEAEVGQAVAECIAEGQVTRKDLWITSKLWNDRHLASDVPKGLDKTLTDLGLDYLDLYLIHWPIALRPGVAFPQAAGDFLSLDEAPTSETWGAMEVAVDAGKCRHIGVSNFSQVKLEALVKEARIKPACNQVELHPFLQQSALVASCKSHEVIVTGYSPLGSGDRPDFLKKPDEPRILTSEVLKAIADRRGVTVAQVALAWQVNLGLVTIPKSVKPHRLAENLAAADIELSSEDMKEIAAMDRAHRYILGDFWALPGGPYTLANLWDE